MNYKHTTTILEYSIIEYFKTEKDNRTAVIAKHFEIETHIVSRVINDYLKSKINKKLNFEPC